MVCGLQHEATHERTAPTITTIDWRHRWAIKGENTSLNAVETGSLVCWVKRWTLGKSVQLELVTPDG